MRTLAMFPLETVLLPGGLIPLHVFEPRYRDMVRDCLRDDGDPEFGQVLITRGREAGGGDERAMVGTLAQMLRVEALDENRYAFLAVGMRRITIHEWLPDDPYPIASVAEWPDAEVDDDRLEAVVATTEGRVRDVLELAARVAAAQTPAASSAGEIGEPGAFEVSSDPVRASYQLASLAPIGPADRFRLLIAPGPFDRLVLLTEILDDVEAMLRFRLT